MELIVLGCAGSYPAPPCGACSGYLVRDGATAIWLDCGHGTFANLQEHVDPGELSAVVITHEHPDHCVDLYGLHVLLRYGLEQAGMPVFAPEGLDARLAGLVSSGWGDAFDWHAVGEGDGTTVGSVDLRFSRTDHPPPTYAVELRADDGGRIVYTADTGPGWSVDAFDAGADLVLSEASYQRGVDGAPWHLTAEQAATAARAAGARRLVLTHIWPLLDHAVSEKEGSEAFGEPVVLAAPHLVTEV